MSGIPRKRKLSYREKRTDEISGAGGKRAGAGRKPRTEPVDGIQVALPVADAAAVRALAKELTYNLGRFVSANEVICSFVKKGLLRYGDGDEEIL